jgi:PAS domain S-box-containing protein
MSRILLLIENDENRHLLAEALAEHEVLTPKTDQELEISFDLCIVDGPTFVRYWERLQARKRADAPVLLPILLVTVRQEIRAVIPELRTVVDDLLVMPIQIFELLSRVEILLRLRRMSLELERRRQELYRTLVEESQAGVFVLTDHQFAYINQAGARLFGYEAEEVVGHMGLLDLVDPEDRPALVEMIRQHRAGERETIRATLRGVSKDGGFVAFDLYGRQSRYLEQPALMGQLIDVTERYEADRAKNQFLAVLSHELRTPLTNILGWTREVREDPTLLPAALPIILRNAETQSRMLENLLEVSRLIHGKLTLQREPTELWQLVTAVVEAMGAEAQERRITLQLEPPDAPLPIAADIKRIHNMIENVLDNALKFTPADGSVTISGQRRRDRAVLTVRDTGRGIAPPEMPTLFTLFRYPQGAEYTGGLRLGLPLVKSIVEMHGGQVTVESSGLDQGTTVTIVLPLRSV